MIIKLRGSGVRPCKRGKWQVFSVFHLMCASLMPLSCGISSIINRPGSSSAISNNTLVRNITNTDRNMMLFARRCCLFFNPQPASIHICTVDDSILSVGDHGFPHMFLNNIEVNVPTREGHQITNP